MGRLFLSRFYFLIVLELQKFFPNFQRKTSSLKVASKINLWWEIIALPQI